MYLPKQCYKIKCFCYARLSLIVCVQPVGKATCQPPKVGPSSTIALFQTSTTSQVEKRYHQQTKLLLKIKQYSSDKYIYLNQQRQIIAFEDQGYVILDDLSKLSSLKSQVGNTL